MYLVRGDTYHFKTQRMAKTTDEHGDIKFEPIVEKPKKAIFTLKKHYDDKDALFEKSFDNEKMTYDEETNYLKFTIESADTKDLEVGKYYCDLEITTNEDDVHTIVREVVEIDWDVTNKVGE